MPGTPFHGLSNLEGFILSGRGALVLHVNFRCAILPSFKLLPIKLIILLLKLPHFFDFVEIDDEAGLQVVHVLDALATEN